MMQDACIRQLQIIGEACTKVDVETKMRSGAIPWRRIIGLRILVVHEYFGVDEIIIWNIIENELPVLKVQIENLLEELG